MGKEQSNKYNRIKQKTKVKYFIVYISYIKNILVFI